MNPLTNMKNVLKLSEGELKGRNRTSWHDQYRGSAWVFVGGLPYDLTEGDIVCVFSQYGDPVNINLVRDKDTGKSKGFCFICYEDQRSTDIIVDNFNGIKILGRTIRVDHVENYKVPKIGKNDDEETILLKKEGLAGVTKEISKREEIVPKVEVKKETVVKKKKKKLKEEDSSSDSDSSTEKRKRRKKKRRKSTSSEDSSSSDSSSSEESPPPKKKNKHSAEKPIKPSKTIEELKREAKLIQEELERRQKAKDEEDKKILRKRSPDKRRKSPERRRSRSRERRRSPDRHRHRGHHDRRK